jgi:hypothetical protein
MGKLHLLLLPRRSMRSGNIAKALLPALAGKYLLFYFSWVLYSPLHPAVFFLDFLGGSCAHEKSTKGRYPSLSSICWPKLAQTFLFYFSWVPYGPLYIAVFFLDFLGGPCAQEKSAKGRCPLLASLGWPTLAQPSPIYFCWVAYDLLYIVVFFLDFLGGPCVQEKSRKGCCPPSF